MYIILSNGKKLTVDDSELDYENDYIPFIQNVGVFTDSTVLNPIWLVQIHRNTSFGKSGLRGRIELEFIAEYKYDHEPTKEEILVRMSENGCTRYDVVTIEKGFELDEDYDD